MIKKIFIFMILIGLSALFYIPNARAETILIVEPPVNEGGLWHELDGNRVYIQGRYTEGETVYESGSVVNPSFTGYDYSNYLFFDVGVEDDLDFTNTTTLKTATISNPDPSIYTSFKVEIITGLNILNGPPPTVVEIADYNTAVNEITIDLNDWADRPLQGPEVYYLYDYSWIDLFADDIKIFTSRNSSTITENDIGIPANPNYMDLLYGWGIRMYWEKETTTDPITPDNPPTDPEISVWDSLPITDGNPSNPIGDWGTVSYINIDNTNEVSFSIEYKGITYPVSSFVVDGDLDFLSKQKDILYYTDSITNDRMLYINFGDDLDSALLNKVSFDNINVWSGEALWNLSQEQIKVTDVLRVYNYIPEVGADGNVYSYFYMPDVPIDNLISVSSMLAYRYWDDGPLGVGDPTPGEIQYKNVTATRGETSTINPTWVESTYKTAYITSVITGIATLTGIIPGYGWAISGVAFLVGGALNIADVGEFFAYDIQQIDHVIPDTSLTNNINSYISETSFNDTFNPDTDKLYKLHLATLQDGDEVQIINDLSNITQVVWETNGEIYVVEQTNIDNIDWGGVGTLEPDDGVDTNLILYIGIGIVALVLFKEFKLDKKPGLIIILLGIVAYILYTQGII
jgi:hypothetical protein